MLGKTTVRYPARFLHAPQLFTNATGGNRRNPAEDVTSPNFWLDKGSVAPQPGPADELSAALRFYKGLIPSGVFPLYQSSSTLTICYGFLDITRRRVIPSRSTSSIRISAPINRFARITTFPAASNPSTSPVGSASAYPLDCASANASV